MSWLERLKNVDWVLLTATTILCAVGLMMVYSTGLSSSQDGALWYRQAVFLVLGFTGLFFFMFLDYRFWLRAGQPVFWVTLLLLVVVLIAGQDIRGATRWFALGPINFQPSELMKLGVIVVLADFFRRHTGLIRHFRYVLLSLFYVVPPAVLIILEPDLGSSLVIFGIWLGVLLAVGLPWRHFLYLLIIFLIVSSVAWQFVLADYQKDRVASFLDPTSDPQGRGYNVIQSMVATGSGGLFGHGLTEGLQSQLRFLPERQTDFIFASTVEELGLLGGGLVLLLFAAVLFRILRIMRRCPDAFGRYVSAGIFFFLLIQVGVNVGMNLGLLPVTGITLPFLSYGGSSLVVSLALIGIVQSVGRSSLPVRF